MGSLSRYYGYVNERKAEKRERVAYRVRMTVLGVLFVAMVLSAVWLAGELVAGASAESWYEGRRIADYRVVIPEGTVPISEMRLNIVVGDRLNIRAFPSCGGEIIGYFVYHDFIVPVAECGGWMLVRHNVPEGAIAGWVWGEYLK